MSMQNERFAAINAAGGFSWQNLVELDRPCGTHFNGTCSATQCIAFMRERCPTDASQRSSPMFLQLSQSVPYNAWPFHSIEQVC